MLLSSVATFKVVWPAKYSTEFDTPFSWLVAKNVLDLGLLWGIRVSTVVSLPIYSMLLISTLLASASVQARLDNIEHVTRSL